MWGESGRPEEVEFWAVEAVVETIYSRTRATVYWFDVLSTVAHQPLLAFIVAVTISLAVAEREHF